MGKWKGKEEDKKYKNYFYVLPSTVCAAIYSMVHSLQMALQLVSATSVLGSAPNASAPSVP